MRILIDESLPIELAEELLGYDVATVRARRWRGLRNGVLLRTAVDAGFEVILTADQSLRHQQNLTKIGIAVVVVIGVQNRMPDVRPLLPQILTALENMKVGQVIEVRWR